MSFVEEILSEDGMLTHKFGQGKYVTLLEKALAKGRQFYRAVVFPAGTPELIAKACAINGQRFHPEWITWLHDFPGVWVAFCRHKKDWELLKKISSQGYDFTSNLGENKVDSFGLNFRMTELLAACIYAKRFG